MIGMRVVGGDHKLADLIVNHKELLPVLNRFNIKPGFGDPTITEICIKKQVDQKFLVLIINTFLNKNYFPEEELKTVSPVLILDYLKETHSYYLEYVLPKIDRLFNNLTSDCKGDCSSISIIVSFYNKYKGELLNHINDEENRVFPYIERLIAAVNRQETIKSEFRISSFEKEHSNVEDKIADLKNILIKHLNASYDINIYNEFIYALSQFEKDLTDHARIEDKILVPLVSEIEGKIFSGHKRKYVHKRVTLRPEEGSAQGDYSSSVALSLREKDVLRLIALGHSNKEIAEKLFISTHTVISHRKNITRKLGIRSISGLTVYSILNKIIDTDRLDPATLI